MPEMISITQEEKERLEARAQKSALDKSYLQLIIRLMNRVSATSGLENLIGNLLRGVADVIGGLNIILYYRIDDNLHYTDVYGRKEQLERIDDPLVQQVFDSRTTLELEHEFSDTKMATAQFGSGYTWVVPLLVGPELVGVLKLESLNIAMRELYQQLPVFFNHAALILKNELQNYALLKSSFEQLQVANRQLNDEILQRERAEDALRSLNEELEQRVDERTAELHNANRLLEQELGERLKAQAALQEQAAVLEEEVEERRRAEHSLENTRQKLHLILESVSEGICSVGISGEITLINSFGAKLFGWEKEELLGKEQHALVHHTKSSGAPYPAAECPVHAALKDGETHKISDEIFWRKDGTSFPVEYVSTPIMEGGVIVGAVFNFRDITERKQAELEILHLKNYLANIIDSMPSLLVGIDPDEQVVLWNRQAESMTGIAAENAVGQGINQLLPEFSPWIESLRHDMQERQPSGMEKLLLEHNGERNFYDLMLYPLVANGIEGAVIRIEDVTERTRIQSLMVQTEKMMSVGGLAAGMAHEINNPLGIIIQAAHNIERRVDPAFAPNQAVAQQTGCSLEAMQAYFEQRQIPQFIASICESSVRAAKIIRNILDFSRNADTSMVLVSLSEVLEQTIELAGSDYDLKKRYDFRSIEIVREYDPSLPPVKGILVELEQVFLNLLKNAAQAMMAQPDGQHPQIVLRLYRQGEYAVAEVEDNGPGMPEEVRRRVFEPFFTTKEPGIGTGLGLSVSYMIVTQNHKGLLEAVSRPDIGACFIVKLPLYKEKQHA